MSYIIKLTVICITASVLTLLIRKNNPEIGLLIGIMTALFCVFELAELYSDLSVYIDRWRTSFSLPKEFFLPMIKCLSVSVITNIGCGVLKDSGQAAVSIGLELCGNAVCLWCILPLIDHLFTVIEGLL